MPLDLDPTEVAILAYRLEQIELKLDRLVGAEAHADLLRRVEALEALAIVFRNGTIGALIAAVVGLIVALVKNGIIH